MSTGRFVKLALIAAITIIAIAIVGMVVLMLIYPDLPEHINGAGVQDIVLLSWRQIQPATGTPYNAPTPLPGISNSSIRSLTVTAWPSEIDTLKTEAPMLKANGSDVAIEDINLTHEGLNLTE